MSNRNIDINNLGTFASVSAVWAAYPEGGQEGDYLYIGSVKYRWNKYNLLWENASTYNTESEARKLTELYADVTVNNDLHVGGTLYYHRMKGYDLGLFASSTSLSTAYPSPEVGMWAFVVHPSISGKYQLYVCSTAGTWTLSVSETTLDILDFERYEEAVALMQQIANGAQLTGYRAAESVNDLPTTDVDPTLGWIVGNKLYVYVGTGGDTLNGKYKNCGELRGAKGDKGDKGDDGVVLDGVTVFDGLGSLTGKTAAEKEEMVPDGNAVDEINAKAVGDVIALRKQLVEPSSLSGSTVNSGFIITADGTITSQSSNDYRVCYFPNKISGGTVIHFSATTSTSRYQRVGYVTTDPAEADPITSLSVNVLDGRQINGSWDYDVLMPTDGWFIFYYYNQNWSGRSFGMYTDMGDIFMKKAFTPEADLAFSDKNGYDIVRFHDGHVKTKNFDSSEIFQTCSVSQFARIAVIGDSWSSGYFYSTSGGSAHVDNRKFSWLANLARRNGVHWYNFAVGGTTAARWLGKAEATTAYDPDTNPTGAVQPRNDSGGGLLAMLNANECDLYFVWLGANERTRERYYMGSIEDAEPPVDPDSGEVVMRHRLVKGTTYVDEPAYPDTFYGNTALILWHIRNKSPKSKTVFICGNRSTTYTGETVQDGDLNGARLEVISAQGLPRIRPSDDPWYRDVISAGTRQIGDHPDVMDNCGISLAIERLFTKVSEEYHDYFVTYYNADAFGIGATANTNEI